MQQRASQSQPGTADGFEVRLARAIPALRLHCYRIVGMLDDAEDMVQETLARAWQHRDRLSDPEGLRPWIYRIATNACLDLLERRRRHPSTTLVAEPDWPDPLPGAWLAADAKSGDPADLLVRRETVDLAFVTAVRLLPPRQRAMLLLRDVLDWSAADVADALGTTVAAVHSGVRRARTALGQRRTGQPPPRTAEAEIARRYLDAWERADVTALADLLAADARMAMPPDERLFEGRTAILDHLESVLREHPSRRIRLRPTAAGAGPAFIVLAPDPATGRAKRIGIKALIIRSGRIAEIRGYMRPGLAARFEVLDGVG